jgi:hypothetical protein
MIACLSLMVFVVAGLAYWAAGFADEYRQAAQPEPAVSKALAPGSFFVDAVPPADRIPDRTPAEALLVLIEAHVKDEKAAAESFVQYPTSALLHSRTMSPLVN